MLIDLHMHSTASDGAMKPSELVRFCYESCGVRTMALTDHDTVAGLAQARRAAQHCGMRFINGIEISSVWGRCSVHIVGLGVAGYCFNLLLFLSCDGEHLLFW